MEDAKVRRRKIDTHRKLSYQCFLCLPQIDWLLPVIMSLLLHMSIFKLA